MQGSRASDRQLWLDGLKGLAIVLVVSGHALRGLDLKGLGDPKIFAFLDPRFYAVHVQLLFFISGILTLTSLRNRETRMFLFERGPRLLLPLIIWTYIFLSLKLLAGPLQNSTIDLRDMFILPIPGKLHLWFL